MEKYIKLENFEKAMEEVEIEDGHLISKKEYEFLQSMKKYLRGLAGLDPLVRIIEEKTNKSEGYSKFILEGGNFNLTVYTKKGSKEESNIGQVQAIVGEAIVENITFETEKEPLTSPPIIEANLIIPLVVRSEI